MNSQQEMNFCRRCGAELSHVAKHVYSCANGHTIFANASPAVGVLLLTEDNEVICLERAIDPGRGRLDFPGGFCDGAETIEAAIARELEEEIGLKPDAYHNLTFLHSGIDPYDHKGETITALSLVFNASLLGKPTLDANDDAAHAAYVPIASLDADHIYFPTLQQAALTLKEGLA